MHIYTFGNICGDCKYMLFFFFFLVYVGVLLSVCLALHCHICCYQGNRVGRLRSAERCTAWRRETCGAQPVAGKKPARDSPTNPVSIPGLWDEIVLTRSDSEVDSFPEEMRAVFLTVEFSVLLSSRPGEGRGGKGGGGYAFSFFFFFFHNTMSIHNLVGKTKHKQRKDNFMQVWRLFLRLQHFHSQWKRNKRSIQIWSWTFWLDSFVFHLLQLKAMFDDYRQAFWYTLLFIAEASCELLFFRWVVILFLEIQGLTSDVFFKTSVASPFLIVTF